MFSKIADPLVVLFLEHTTLYTTACRATLSESLQNEFL